MHPPVTLRRCLIALVGAVGLAAGCDKAATAPGAVMVGALELSATRTAVRVRNTGPVLARVLLVDAELRTLVMLAPCDSNCPGIAPGATVDVPVSRVLGFSETTTSLQVTYWLFSPGPNDRVDASMVGGTVRVP